MTTTTIYTAKLVRTANESQPTAQAVAVRDGRVLAVGTLEDCLSWGEATVDTRFENYVISAGFVEAHGHQMESIFAHLPYVGWYERWMPDGTMSPSVKSVEQLIARLSEIESTMPAGEPLIAMGLDPIYYGGERVNRHHLDAVTTERPVMVIHQSGHLTSVNTFVIEKYDINASAAPGIGRDASGYPNGELREPPAMSLARDEFRKFSALATDPNGVLPYAESMRNAGITTSTDLGNYSIRNTASLEPLGKSTSAESFAIRMVAANIVDPAVSSFPDLQDRISALRDAQHPKLHFPVVKLMLDGSIQGFTAMISWPGYFKGEDHGQFLQTPEQVVDILRPFHKAGIGIHSHCNGDLAAGVFIDAIEQLLIEHPWLNHRHTVTHSQLITNAQLRKVKALGMCCNFFSNHVWTWGDQHREITVGPDRADRIDPIGTAERLGISYTLHSDAPVTEPGQLRTMWSAVNRLTPSGRVLGANERISAERAYYAVTIDAAYQLHMDHLVGSIEVGKYADFAILSDDPITVDPMKIRDIKVWGTVLGGVVQQSTRQQ